MNESVKNPLKSKTLWTNFILAGLVIFYPPAAAWAQASPEALAAIFSGVNILLRLITKDKLSLE